MIANDIIKVSHYLIIRGLFTIYKKLLNNFPRHSLKLMQPSSSDKEKQSQPPTLQEIIGKSNHSDISNAKDSPEIFASHQKLGLVAPSTLQTDSDHVK